MLKPLLGPCDSYQLEPFSYEWAWIMSRQQESNTWSPDEISVASDIADYKNPDLDPKYRHLFDAVMAQLTTFDIERGDDAAETFLSVFQPAEIRHYLKRLVWDEALHTRSYRYIIENLGIPLSIYDRWKEVPAMKARVEAAQNISKPVEKIVGTHLLQGAPYHEISLADKQAILRSLIYWGLLYEGVWFYLNLQGPIQQLARLGYFQGAAENLTYILRDEQSHINFCASVTREYMAQYPECITEEFLSWVEKDAVQAVRLEQDFIQYCLKDGPILGYSAHEHVATAKFFTNMRLATVGLPQPFDDAQHCFPWMSEQNELRKEKNWFEKKPTEYQVGALQFDDLAHHDNWDDPLKEMAR